MNIDIQSVNGVLWFIESVVRHDNDMFTLKGCIAHNGKSVAGISLGDRVIMMNPTPRPDIRSQITEISEEKIGVEFTVHKSELDTPVNVLYSDGTFSNNIGSLDFWVIRNATFTKVPKKGIIVVDNFYEDPDSIREFAMNKLKFRESGYHKGQRSENRFIINGTKERFEEILGKEIINWNHPNYANGVFQFCTAMDPIVYHVDTQTYAAMIYLTPNAPLATGTATYRSKLTGATRFDSFDENPELFSRTFKGVSNEPNFYDSTSYEPVDSIANVYNRLVMFDSKTIHAATGYFGDAIQNARFFQLFFFDVKW